MPRRIAAHVPGLIYTGLLTLVGLAAMNNQNNLLFWVFGVFAAGLVVSALISTIIIRSVRVRRIDPQHGAVGEPLVVRYVVTNRSRLFSAFNVHLAETPPVNALATGGDGSDWSSFMAPAAAWVMHVGPRESLHGEAIFWPTRRGRVTFERMRVWSAFPFGIIRKTRTCSQPQHTLIYPMLYELRPGFLSSIAPRGLMGSKVSHRAGAGDDYYGTREYKPGDSMRHIAWKRAARLDQLISIDRTSPSPARLRVILDLTVPTSQLHVEPAGPEQARDLEERAISLAASVLHAADLDGFEVGLTIMGFPAPDIAVRRNQWHYNKVMAALAGIDLDASRLGARSRPIRDAERAAIVVIAPDRVQPFAAREDAIYLTARQLDTLAVRPIGWDARRRAAGVAPNSPKDREAEAAA